MLSHDSVVVVVLLLTGFFAWDIPPTGQTQDACFGFYLTSEPGPLFSQPA